MHLLFSTSHQSENPFPAFFSVIIFSSLINMPIIRIEETETSLLTLLGVSLVLWRRNADSALSNPCFMTLPLTSQHLNFQFPIYFNFQNFLLEVVAIGRKKCQKGFNIPPLAIATASQTNCNFLCPLMHCHAHPWGGGGEFLPRGKGRVESMK
jgi:hypothetical protein